MIVAAAIVAVLVSVPLTGGRLARLSDVRLRWPWLPVLAFAGQVLVLAVLDLSASVSAVLHVATYVPILAFVAANRRHPGVWIFSLGLGLNSLAIVANEGVMPASAEAMRRAGIRAEEGFENSAVVDDARLPWLGDVFYVPDEVPLANVFSIGDVLIIVGAAVFVHRASRVPGPGTNDVRAPTPAS